MFFPADADQYRMERKFLFESLSRPAIEALVRTNPAMFSEVFRERWVNNIYLDTESLHTYRANVDGRGRDRVKVRIRWYGASEGELDAPRLELKIKQGHANCKRVFDLPCFRLEDDLSAIQIRRLFAEADLPESLRQNLANLAPVLVNRYRRRYFVSSDKRHRITVDSELSYHEPRRCCDASRGAALRQLVILELKYAPPDEEVAARIAQHFPLRLTRSSKYVMGVEHLERMARVAGSQASPPGAVEQLNLERSLEQTLPPMRLARASDDCDLPVA